MRTARLRLTAAATLALSAFAGVGLSAAGDSGSATWSTLVTPSLPTAGRTIALTQFVGDVGVWAVQDLLVGTTAAQTWTMDISVGTPMLRDIAATSGGTALSKDYAKIQSASAFSPVADLTNAAYTVTPTGTLPNVLGVVSAASVSAAAVTAPTITPGTVIGSSSIVVANATYATTTTATTALYPGQVSLSFDIDGALAAASLPVAEQTGKKVDTSVTFTLLD